MPIKKYKKANKNAIYLLINLYVAYLQHIKKILILLSYFNVFLIIAVLFWHHSYEYNKQTRS